MKEKYGMGAWTFAMLICRMCEIYGYTFCYSEYSGSLHVMGDDDDQHEITVECSHLRQPEDTND